MIRINLNINTIPGTDVAFNIATALRPLHNKRRDLVRPWSSPLSPVPLWRQKVRPTRGALLLSNTRSRRIENVAKHPLLEEGPTGKEFSAGGFESPLTLTAVVALRDLSAAVPADGCPAYQVRRSRQSLHPCCPDYHNYLDLMMTYCPCRCWWIAARLAPNDPTARAWA